MEATILQINCEYTVRRARRLIISWGARSISNNLPGLAFQHVNIPGSAFSFIVRMFQMPRPPLPCIFNYTIPRYTLYLSLLAGPRWRTLQVSGWPGFALERGGSVPTPASQPRFSEMVFLPAAWGAHTRRLLCTRTYHPSLFPPLFGGTHTGTTTTVQ